MPAFHVDWRTIANETYEFEGVDASVTFPTLFFLPRTYQTINDFAAGIPKNISAQPHAASVVNGDKSFAM